MKEEKMAAVAAIHTALTHLGFSHDAAANIMNVQEIDLMAELKFLTN